MDNFDEKNGEQPDVKGGLTADNYEESDQVKHEGSPLGKFKNAESLLDAYNNLQAEFTKRCQKISEMQKKFDEISDNVTKESDEPKEITSLEQVVKEESDINVLDAQNKTPLYLSEDWQAKVEDFFSTHKYAANIITELADELMRNPELACNADCLELAYNKILAQKFRSENELLKSEDFISKILNDDDIKMKVISNYLSGLDRQNTPAVISQTKGSYTNLASNKKVSNLTEARQLAELLFNY